MSALTPAEKAYCDWADARMEKGLYGMAGEQLAFVAGHAAAVEACAAGVETAGCRCGLDSAKHIAATRDYSFAEVFGGEGLVAYQKERDAALANREHEPWCPIALAARLRELAR